jgi:hypothetical protein
VSQRSLQNSPLESSCVVVALVENYSTAKLFKVSAEKSHILGSDTAVANYLYVQITYYVRLLIRRFLGASAKIRKATIRLVNSVCRSVCLCALNNSAPTEGIEVKFYI